MALQKKQKIFYRRGKDGERIKIYVRTCWRCRVWYGTPFEEEPWECPMCKGKREKEQKRWPMARKVER